MTANVVMRVCLNVAAHGSCVVLRFCNQNAIEYFCTAGSWKHAAFIEWTEPHPHVALQHRPHKVKGQSSVTRMADTAS